MIRFASALAVIVLICGVPGNCPAQQRVIECHCFKDRSYDPASRFAADDYILATSFNSMLAAYFDISKRQIIMMRMQGGVDGDDLRTSLYLGKVLGIDFQELLPLRTGGQSWSQIVKSHDRGMAIDDPVVIAAGRGSSDEEMGRAAVAMLISSYYAVPLESIEKYRGLGFSDKEIALCLGLSASSGQAVDDLVSQYKDRGRSWGEIADSLNIAAENIGEVIAKAKTR